MSNSFQMSKIFHTVKIFHMSKIFHISKIFTCRKILTCRYMFGRRLQLGGTVTAYGRAAQAVAPALEPVKSFLESEPRALTKKDLQR